MSVESRPRPLPAEGIDVVELDAAGDRDWARATSETAAIRTRAREKPRRATETGRKEIMAMNPPEIS
jgi:hypothetical protein